MAEDALVNNDGQPVAITVDEGGDDSPFAPKGSAVPSPEASPEEPKAEPAALDSKVVQPAAPVIPGTPAATQEPVDPAAEPAPAESTPSEPAPVEPDPVALEKLARWREGSVTEAQRAAQSAYDRRAAAIEARNQELTQSVTDLRNQMRDKDIAELSPEEQEEARAKWALADKSEELDSRETDLNDYYKFLLVESYKMEFSDYGVSEETLKEFETPEQMGAYCMEQKANFFEKQVKDGRATVATPITPAAEPEAKTEPEIKPVAAVPAGAKAPVDVAIRGAGEPEVKPNIGKGPAAMREALAAMKSETIR